jgi:hypothetical protein
MRGSKKGVAVGVDVGDNGTWTEVVPRHRTRRSLPKTPTHHVKSGRCKEVPSDAQEFWLRMPVEVAGWMIGRSGYAIREFQDRFRCHIDVVKGRPSMAVTISADMKDELVMGMRHHVMSAPKAFHGVEIDEMFTDVSKADAVTKIDTTRALKMPSSVRLKRRKKPGPVAAKSVSVDTVALDPVSVEPVSLDPVAAIHVAPVPVALDPVALDPVALDPVATGIVCRYTDPTVRRRCADVDAEREHDSLYRSLFARTYPWELDPVRRSDS